MSEEERFLCSYNLSLGCEVFVTYETAWRDSEGNLWDVCKPCAEREDRMLQSILHGNG